MEVVLPGNKRSRRLVLAAVLIAAPLAIFLGAFVFGLYQTLGLVSGRLLLDNSPEQYAETRVRAQGVLDALDEYHTSRADYPSTLAELAPAFLPDARPPLVGKGKWEYKRVGPSHFVLRFFVGPTYESDTFDSQEQRWDTDR
jgi:hypothetical protein